MLRLYDCWMTNTLDISENECKDVAVLRLYKGWMTLVAIATKMQISDLTQLI